MSLVLRRYVAFILRKKRKKKAYIGQVRTVYPHVSTPKLLNELKIKFGTRMSTLKVVKLM